MYVAITTCAILRHPYGTEQTASFESLTEEVFRVSDKASGLVARAVYHDERDDLEDTERDWGPWGPLALPRFCADEVTFPYRAAQSLTVWESLEAVKAFSYGRGGLHSTALRRRREWFIKTDWPTYCLWWVSPSHQVTWVEGVNNLDFLHQNGSSERAFTFDAPFYPGKQG